MEKDLEKKLSSIESRLEVLIQTLCNDAMSRISQDQIDLKKERDEKNKEKEKADKLQDQLNLMMVRFIEPSSGKDYKTAFENLQKNAVKKEERIENLEKDNQILREKVSSMRLMYSKQVRSSVAIEKEHNNLKEKIYALEKENTSLKKRTVSSSTSQILSTRIHNLEEELREVRKENISLKEEKTNSEKVILLMKQVEELKKENNILKDILNDPEK